ncbi:MAG: type IV pilus secretin PilQ [Pseudomonadales bacterium]|nr:type IV pilus secretin PilQ [Pseudomonadales bacterium]
MFFNAKNAVWTSLIAVLFFPLSVVGATLNDVSFASLPGDKTEIRFSFDQTPPMPKGYTIERPARIALDIPDVSSALKSKYHNLGVGNAQSLTVIEAKDRVRVIINLVELVPYSSVRHGNELVVVVGSGSLMSPSSGEHTEGASTVSGQQPGVFVSTSAVAQANQEPALESIDFKRGEKGDGQVVLSLNTASVDVDMSEQAGNIRLEFKGVALPAELKRRFDVTDFATAVTRIDALSEEGNAVILIRPEGNYDFLAYQADNQFTVSVEALTSEEVEQRRKEKFPYSGEKLSLNFQDIDVRAVLQLIADFTGLNLVASDTVSGKITLRLQNVPWDQALELVLKTKGLDKRKVGNVLLVAPAAEIAAREKLELETSKQVKELAPVRLEIVQVNYAKAADIVRLLRADKELISDRGFISSDTRTNSVSVRETSDKLDQIRRLVTKWDVPVRQVLIEARIVRARSNLTQDLGIQWGGGYLTQKGDSLYRVGGSSSTLAELTEVAAGDSNTITFPDALAVDLGVTRVNTSSIALGYGNDNMLIDMELSAFETDGKGEIVAQPKIVTADRKKAIIKSGEQIPYQEASSSGATSVSFKEAALSLEVTPQITPDDKIIMDLKINQDARGEVTGGIPSIDTNEIETQVLVGNGETIVLGGIFQAETSTTVTKTPFLGDLPYIGSLFKKTEEIDERGELLIFITPKLLKGGLTDQ